jgi:hypothetical protein
MSLATCARTMGFVVGLGQVVAACGQNTPDRLSFALPTSSFVLSSDSPAWRQVPDTVSIPNMVCGGPQALATDCCAPPNPIPSIDCEQYPVACDPTTNFCALTFDMEVGTEVDLVARVAEVGAVEGRIFASVSLLSLSTSASNVPALPIRSANLYIAPGDVSGSSNPAAVLLSRVELTAGSTPATPTPEGRQAFAALARDYRAPFSLWLSAHLVVPNGSTPSGTVTFTVDAHAEARY